ncbi:MAG: prefoldin subunit alpha [Methanofollis liminatans]|jgi:prefoldin alpha subunit|uniref:Prefoldin subunit alpha n=1 Tax=Methanofollis liminatans DSM 4140 TaxID=28892 RepID=J0SAP1_9EURY|nr:prefoldin subunit alpha [Methanofollis liminatans]EJG07754.1 Prefoldin subunit alpha [Methanofollis liminatans DSM 4140]MDD3110700.1 prefoldin subunit alpha [Methanofollis liminatans]
MSEADPRELQSLQYYLNEYGQQAEIFARQLEMLEQQRVESIAAIETLQALGSAQDGTVLLPLGGGVSVRATIPDPEHVLVAIGADVTVGRDNAGAVSYLEDRARELEASEKKISEMIENIRAQMNDIAARLDAAYRGQQQVPGR